MREKESSIKNTNFLQKLDIDSQTCPVKTI